MYIEDKLLDLYTDLAKCLSRLVSFEFLETVFYNNKIEFSPDSFTQIKQKLEAYKTYTGKEKKVCLD